MANGSCVEKHDGSRGITQIPRTVPEGRRGRAEHLVFLLHAKVSGLCLFSSALEFLGMLSPL